MRERSLRPSAVLPDTNLFVAAIRGGGRVTDSQRLLVALIEDEETRLIGDVFLAAEITKYADAFRSPAVRRLEAGLLGKLEILEPREALVRACEPYFSAASKRDAIHAAACMHARATLVSDDHDFDAVVEAGLIDRLTITQALHEFL